MQNTNKKNQVKDTQKNLIKINKTESKKDDKSESYDIQKKVNRKLSQINVNKKRENHDQPRKTPVRSSVLDVRTAST